MTTQQTIWDLFGSTKFRASVLLLIGGILGVLLMGWILRVPLGISLLVGLFIGGWGVAASFLELIVRAVANSRAVITLRPREPYEFIRYSAGWINIAHLSYARLADDGSINVWQLDGEFICIPAKEARQFEDYLNERASPLWAMDASKAEAAQPAD